jgi:putative sugar O-methyltransferase
VRIKQLYLKAKSAWASGTLHERAKRFLKTQVVRFFEVLGGYITLRKDDRNLNLKAGFQNHSNNHRSDPAHLRRIINAYKAAKRAQPSEGPFQIRGLWEEWIAVHYDALISALEREDIPSLSQLLENLYREKFTSGTGGYDNYLQYHSLFGKAYIKYVWSRYRDKLAALDYDLRELSFPCVGNPAGVFYNDQVISIETLRHAYRAVEISELVRDLPNAIIVEIGGGLGGEAYQAIQRGISKYTVFDIPEVVVISSYFLLSAFPDKRVRLFGEEATDYDIQVLPHFAIAQLPDLSVDLFYNSCSFSEMDGKSSREYLTIIERACRKYFMHDNHDCTFIFKNADGTISQNVVGSKLIPNGTLFKRIYKKPRVHGLPEDRSFVHYEYLYERIEASFGLTCGKTGEGTISGGIGLRTPMSVPQADLYKS